MLKRSKLVNHIRIFYEIQNILETFNFSLPFSNFHLKSLLHLYRTNNNYSLNLKNSVIEKTSRIVQLIFFFVNFSPSLKKVY